jgi:ArsR family transcriptional regulator, arsenate/arsenite/antimonite-responsive transcriptional repressor
MNDYCVTSPTRFVCAKNLEDSATESFNHSSFLLYFDNSTIIEMMNTALLPPQLQEPDVLRALAALAQTQRLRIFRALVVAGDAGLTPGGLAERLEVAPSALSFHLKELAHSGLVSAEQRGRHLIYRADFAQMNQLLAYLTEHCCAGLACELDPAAKLCC